MNCITCNVPIDPEGICPICSKQHTSTNYQDQKHEDGQETSFRSSQIAPNMHSVGGY